MPGVFDSFMGFMHRGGVVMWPLLALSVVVVALALERCWFFMVSNRPGRLRRVERMAAMLRRGDLPTARQLAADDGGIYGDLVRRLLDSPDAGNAEKPSGEGDQAQPPETGGLSDSAAVEAVEAQRRRLERFMPTLSTIITAAPMLGILGTVLGIISSFEILSNRTAASDPSAVSRGIAEALITTAAGLVIALVALFPYNALRAQIDRTLSRLEALAGAAIEGRRS